MAENKEEFQFPDEIDEKEVATSNEIDIEIEDDTPEEDRNRQPMPKEIVDELEKDNLEAEEYSAAAKEKLKQLKKVWNDERRAKETALREHQEAVTFAKKTLEENKRIRAMLQTGEKEYVESVKTAAELELEKAKRLYKDAYDIGDTDALITAQEAMQNATYKLQQVKNFKLPPLQQDETNVKDDYQAEPSSPQPDRRAMSWQQRNQWFGQDKEMTAAALGLHEKLKEQGVEIGSDEYYSTLDKTMRKRFNEFFDEPEETNKSEPARTKPSTVVAPAMRSTSSNKIKLKASQVQLAKKLGLTPEQYAQAAIKLENQNGR